MAPLKAYSLEQTNCAKCNEDDSMFQIWGLIHFSI